MSTTTAVEGRDIARPSRIQLKRIVWAGALALVTAGTALVAAPGMAGATDQLSTTSAAPTDTLPSSDHVNTQPDNPNIDIRPGLFVNNGVFWSTAPTATAGDRSVVRRTTGPNPGITATGPTGSVFHRMSGVSKYLFFGSGNHLLILESKAQAARVTHTVTQINFTTSPPREKLIMTASASSTAVPPPRVQFSQVTGDAFFVFGSTGTQLVGMGIYRSGNGEIICGNQPISQPNAQLVAEATATQVRIKNGGTVIRSCTKPAS